MNATVTPAQKMRNQHIAKVKAEIVRLQNAVTAIEKHTIGYPDWRYVGDWQALAQDVIDATDRAERMAEQTSTWWKARQPNQPDGEHTGYMLKGKEY